MTVQRVCFLYMFPFLRILGGRKMSGLLFQVEWLHCLVCGEIIFLLLRNLCHPWNLWNITWNSGNLS